MAAAGKSYASRGNTGIQHGRENSGRGGGVLTGDSVEGGKEGQGEHDHLSGSCICRWYDGRLVISVGTTYTDV